jgi:hypothetical protein
MNRSPVYVQNTSLFSGKMHLLKFAWREPKVWILKYKAVVHIHLRRQRQHALANSRDAHCIDHQPLQVYITSISRRVVQEEIEEADMG